jgi:serine/threonine-protein kinase
VWAAIDAQSAARGQVVVVERALRAGLHAEQEIEGWLGVAKQLAPLDHMNVARVRDVVVRREDALVASDFVDGVRWSELAWSDPRPPLDVALRVLIDALAGLSAIHNQRDANRKPLKLFHGALTPYGVIVGVDGVARIVGAQRLRVESSAPADAASAYLAPEVLLADDAADAKADVYSVGVMLWEALMGRALFEHTQASAIVTRALSGPAPRAAVPASAPWAAPLADSAARALSADPSKRHPSAATLGAELRRIAGAKLAQPPRVAALVRAGFGETVRLRREAIERLESGGHEVPAPAPQSARVWSEVPVDVDFEEAVATTPPPPADPVTQRPPPVQLEDQTIIQVRPNAPAPTRAGRPPRLPPAAMKVPPAPPVPKDLPSIPDDVDTVEELDSSGLESARPSAPPSVPAARQSSAPPIARVSPSSLPVARSRRRRRALLLAIPMVLTPALLLWLTPTKSHREGPTSEIPSSSIEPTPPKPNTAAAPPPSATASAAPEPAPEPIVPSATASDTPAPEPQASAAAVLSAEPAPPPPVATQTAAPTTDVPFVAPPAPQPFVRPATKKKYEPEGI